MQEIKDLKLEDKVKDIQKVLSDNYDDESDYFISEGRIMTVCQECEGSAMWMVGGPNGPREKRCEACYGNGHVEEEDIEKLEETLLNPPSVEIVKEQKEKVIQLLTFSRKNN